MNEQMKNMKDLEHQEMCLWYENPKDLSENMKKAIKKECGLPEEICADVVAQIEEVVNAYHKQRGEPAKRFSELCEMEDEKNGLNEAQRYALNEQRIKMQTETLKEIVAPANKTNDDVELVDENELVVKTEPDGETELVVETEPGDEAESDDETESDDEAEVDVEAEFDDETESDGETESDDETEPDDETEADDGHSLTEQKAMMDALFESTGKCYAQACVAEMKKKGVMLKERDLEEDAVKARSMCRATAMYIQEFKRKAAHGGKVIKLPDAKAIALCAAGSVDAETAYKRCELNQINEKQRNKHIAGILGIAVGVCIAGVALSVTGPLAAAVIPVIVEGTGTMLAVGAGAAAGLAAAFLSHEMLSSKAQTEENRLMDHSVREEALATINRAEQREAKKRNPFAAIKNRLKKLCRRDKHDEEERERRFDRESE